MKRYEKPIMVKQSVSLGDFFMSGCGEVTMNDLQVMDDSYEFIALNIEGAGTMVVGGINVAS